MTVRRNAGDHTQPSPTSKAGSVPMTSRALTSSLSALTLIQSLTVAIVRDPVIPSKNKVSTRSRTVLATS